MRKARLAVGVASVAAAGAGAVLLLAGATGLGGPGEAAGDREAPVPGPTVAPAAPHRPAGASGLVGHPSGASGSPRGDRRPRRPDGTFIGASGARLLIPSLGVDAPLVPTGAVGPVGSASLTIPADVRTVAWWDGYVTGDHAPFREDASRPGQPGVAVIAGHVSSAVEGPGALYRLVDISTGAKVEVVGSNGRPSSWTVTSPPGIFLKADLPSGLWRTSGPPRLALVTCGGPFDPATGHFLDNVVVWASLDRSPAHARRADAGRPLG